MSTHDLEKIFEASQNYQREYRKSSVDTRLKFLDKLGSYIEANQTGLLEVLQQDLGKAFQESMITEIMPVLLEIKEIKKNLKKWMKTQRVSTPLFLLGSSGEIRQEARGVCLVLAPWNYPFQLSINPLIAALSAGNTVFLKPSEFAPATASWLQKCIQDVFSQEQVHIELGDGEMAQKLLNLPFDHVFFTGSTQVGKKVMQAAAQHLSSVTLELGGKSPVILDRGIDWDESAEKIIWGKMLNAGQTCVAPDFLLVPEDDLNQAITSLKKACEKLYGNLESLENNSDYPRIISARHFLRLNHLLKDAEEKGAKIYWGGQINEASRFMAPTLMGELSVQAQINTEEIFGPLLPVFTYKDLADLNRFLSEKKLKNPLALYVFSKRQEFIEAILNEHSSGGVCLNNVIVHFAHPHLPFGGVGSSGMGNYHGEFGFKNFSHQRAVMYQNKPNITKLLYPPYKKQVKQVTDLMKKFFT